jgi:cell division protein FtsL
MNATSNARKQTSLYRFVIPELSINQVINITLLILMIVSAFAVIYCRDSSRQLMSELQSQKLETNQLTMQHSQLLVEDSALATEDRIVRLAKLKLQMQLPTEASLVLVKS